MPQPATREDELTAANVSYSIRLVMAQECFYRASQPGTMYGVADADCRNLRMGSAVLKNRIRMSTSLKGLVSITCCEASCSDVLCPGLLLDKPITAATLQVQTFV